MLEQSPLGRVFVVDAAPRPLFYTTIDFDGRLTPAIEDFIRDRFGIDATLSTCRQVHGAGVRRQSRGFGREDECDALYTTERRVALGIKIADCLPVTIIDPDHDVIANIHSGWRGAVQRITAVTLDALEREAQFVAKDALAFFGPTIRVCCFEVGEEVAALFAAPFVDRKYAKPHVDIVAMTTALLQQRGFDTSRIIDSGLCTRCDGSIFHSYRREGKRGGRNLAIAAQ